MNRRAFFATLFAPLAARVLKAGHKPPRLGTAANLFNPVANVAQQWKESRLSLRTRFTVLDSGLDANGDLTMRLSPAV